MNFFKNILNYVALSLVAALSAVNYIIFIFPNDFAPSGIDGLCTMIQYITHINIGYFSMLVNVPLLIAAYFCLKKDYVFKTLTFIIVFSAASIFLKNYTNISSLCYRTATGTSTVLAPIAAGAVRGVLYFFTIRLNGSSGGIDIISALINAKKPHINLMNIIFCINLPIMIMSYFVYGFCFEPVICGIVYSFLASKTSNSLLSLKKESVKLEIVTSHSEELCTALTQQFNQAATIINAKGAFSGQEKKILFCVTSKEKVSDIESLIESFPNSIYFESPIQAHKCVL